ncbi:MAG: flagellar basal-body rod protein FlgF [Gammaproteobacteria bacterium]|nr:MAG: flagellar basal-body rod protein FlgF [Gammaproteobacteria bacterium]
MDRMIFLAMNGARQLELAQAVNTQNLANVSTTGFRADLASVRALEIKGEGLPTRIYAVTEGETVDFSHGSILTTGRELDIAVSGDGWIAVQGRDGTEAYTRAGDFRVSASGQLETGVGHPVLGNDGPISVPPAETVTIGADGTVSVRPLGQTASTLTVVDRIKLVNPPKEDLTKGADGLIRLRGEPGAVADADIAVRVVSGSLESSNVNAIEAMVNMITLSRQFEMQIKGMKTAEEVDQAAVQLMRIG